MTSSKFGDFDNEEAPKKPSNWEAVKGQASKVWSHRWDYVHACYEPLQPSAEMSTQERRLKLARLGLGLVGIGVVVRSFMPSKINFATGYVGLGTCFGLCYVHRRLRILQRTEDVRRNKQLTVELER